jgi:hypothetical protein
MDEKETEDRYDRLDLVWTYLLIPIADGGHFLLNSVHPIVGIPLVIILLPFALSICFQLGLLYLPFYLVGKFVKFLINL